MIGVREAAAAARRALHDPPGANYADAAAGGWAGEPLLVTRLDDPDASYYLTPWRNARGIVLIVQVDAADGALRSIASLPEPITAMIIAKDRALALVADAGTPPVGAPDLVWEPSRQSVSPLQPLYRVPIAGGAVFVASNGSIHDRLTPLGRGG